LISVQIASAESLARTERRCAGMWSLGATFRFSLCRGGDRRIRADPTDPAFLRLPVRGCRFSRVNSDL